MIIISLINSQYSGTLVKTDMDETCHGVHTDTFKRLFNYLAVTVTTSYYRNLKIIYHSLRLKLPFNILFVLKYINGILHDFSLY